MTVSTNFSNQSDSAYYSQTDKAELERLNNLNPGLGEAIYDQDSELEDFFGELGLDK